MEGFSLLSISGPRLSSSALSTFPDIMSSRATSLPDIAKTAGPMEASCPVQALPPQHLSSTLRHGAHNAVLPPDGVPGDGQRGEWPRRSCTIYRPWFSPYSYFVCADKDSHPGARGLPEGQRDVGRSGSSFPEDTAESVCSSSSSPENSCPHEATKKGSPGPDSDLITSQDILAASRCQLTQQSGYKCAACCRLHPTLRSLQSHIRGGCQEGFSCRVYYRKLKALWGREVARPSARPPPGGSQAFEP